MSHLLHKSIWVWWWCLAKMRAFKKIQRIRMQCHWGPVRKDELKREKVKIIMKAAIHTSKISFPETLGLGCTCFLIAVKMCVKFNEVWQFSFCTLIYSHLCNPSISLSTATLTALLVML